MRIEQEIAILSKQKEEADEKKPQDIRLVMAYVRYFLEHLDYLLLKQVDPIRRANFFGVLFNKAPTYQEIVSGTQNPSQLTGINELFRISKTHNGNLVIPRGIEPLLPG